MRLSTSIFLSIAVPATFSVALQDAGSLTSSASETQTLNYDQVEDLEKSSSSLDLHWPVSSRLLQANVRKDGLMKNLAELYQIALDNGNQRAFGYPGFDRSRDYIQSKLDRYKRTSISWQQDFPALFNQVNSINFTASGTEYYVYGLTYSPSTDALGINAQLVLGPNGTDACFDSSYANLNVAGRIVLVERGTCSTGGTLAGRVKPAASAGAAAVIIYNNIATNVTAGTLSAPNATAFVPAGFINQSDGQDLRVRLEGGEVIQAFFAQNQTIETRITQNIFAETKGGDPDNVIMLGAHLDSVPAGPGINDDGSGSSLIMELFEALQKFKTKNKIRFAWWGAEEIGLVGSRYYTRNLSPANISSLLCYLNFDMVSRGYYGVFDGDGSAHGLSGPAGSGIIEQLFVNDLTSKGYNVTPAVFTGGSDYASFMDELRKPVGGLHTGTGIAQDPCYHQACDTYSNADPELLEVNAKTAAHVLAILAMEGEKLIAGGSSNSSSTTGQIKRDVGAFQWTVIEGERHTGCGDHDDE